jgi:hypothetical protein
VKETVMKKIAVLVLSALVGSLAFAAALPDAKAIVGTWKAVEGKYSDGTVEKELDMVMTFTATTMSDPMSKDGLTHKYSLDAKTKFISIKEPTLEMRIAYRFDDKGNLVLTELSVIKDKKTTSIIGKGDTAMFAELLMARQK